MSMEEALNTIQNGQDDFYFHYKRKLGLTQEDLAMELGTTTQYVYGLLNGRTKGAAARKNLNKLFKFTNYKGESWIK